MKCFTITRTASQCKSHGNSAKVTRLHGCQTSEKCSQNRWYFGQKRIDLPLSTMHLSPLSINFMPPSTTYTTLLCDYSKGQAIYSSQCAQKCNISHRPIKHKTLLLNSVYIFPEFSLPLNCSSLVMSATDVITLSSPNSFFNSLSVWDSSFLRTSTKHTCNESRTGSNDKKIYLCISL